MAPSITTTASPETASDITQPDELLAGTLSRLLAPLARLCLANGATFSAVEDALKRAFIQEADKLQPDAPRHGMVSRISTATGISRREVARLTASGAPMRPTKPPLATELFARWITDPALRDQDGVPCPLKRQGPAPSFEAIAQSITRDVHPRSMLDELIRLGIVRHDEDSDRVTLARNDFVPTGNTRQLLGFLGDNVGDHLEAAVDNLVQGDHRHHEQAVFADELSAESAEALRPLIAAHWQALRNAMVPVITDLIEADRLAGRAQDQRVRIGLYTYNEKTPNSAIPANKPSTTPKQKNYSKES